MEFVQKKVPVSELLLDPSNPRFFQLRELKGKKNLRQKDLIDEISRDDEIPTLLKSIKKSGVKDPIWIKPHKSKYLVIEGNRRTYILQKLLDEGVTPPKGIRYDLVIANAYKKDISETELLLQRVRLQAGKKVWGPFNEAVATYELRHKHNLEEEDIAVELQISRREVRERIKNYKMFLEFAKKTKVADPKKFAFFTDAPKPVKEWVESDTKNKSTYFNLIIPKDGVQKIRSVATKGGLRDFKQVLSHPKTLKKFLKDDDMTVEEAFEEVKDLDIRRAAPFLNRLESYANKLNTLSEEQIERLQDDTKAVKGIKRLYIASKRVLDKMKSDAKK